MGVRRRTRLAVTSAAVATALAVGLAPAAAASPFPGTITLPNDAVAGDLGYQPEGIVVRGKTAYVGSLVDGTVVTVDLLTGRSTRLVAPDGDPAVGLELYGRYLLVAGGPSGEIRVYDARTGREVAVRQTGGGFINDIAVIGNTAYATDSQGAALYALPLGGREVGQVREVPLSGDFILASGFNANGIVAYGRHLIVGQTSDPDGQGSALYDVDPDTGVARRIAISGGDIENADGLQLRGNKLYVVQNQSNSIAVLSLSYDLRRAHLEQVLTDPDLQVPTTADFALGALYAVNARFGTEPSDAVAYDVVRVDLNRGGRR